MTEKKNRYWLWEGWLWQGRHFWRLQRWRNICNIQFNVCRINYVKIWMFARIVNRQIQLRLEPSCSRGSSCQDRQNTQTVLSCIMYNNSPVVTFIQVLKIGVLPAHTLKATAIVWSAASMVEVRLGSGKSNLLVKGFGKWLWEKEGNTDCWREMGKQILLSGVEPTNQHLHLVQWLFVGNLHLFCLVFLVLDT